MTSAPVPPLPPSAFFPSALSSPSQLPEELRRWDIYLLPHAFTAPSYPPAAHKSTARACYDQVSAEFKTTLGDASGDTERMVEILLPVHVPSPEQTDSEMEISEGTLTTPFFYRDGQWITPRAAAGGCLGVSRRYALEQRIAVEGRVPESSVHVGETVWLGNGVRGFSWGVVHAWPGHER